MTEPPEPRRPEEDGGEEDYDAAWDRADADEIMDGLEDDALMDSIRDGMHGDLTGDELADLLAGLRDVPDSVDIPVPNLARVERGENVLPPRESEQPTMSAQDAAARLNQLGNSTNEMGMLQQLVDGLKELQNQASAALGDPHSERDNVLGPIQQTITEAEALAATLGAALGEMRAAAGRIG